MKVKDFMKLVRIKHYVKNLFIFLPTFFGLKFLDINILEKNVIAFLAFCLVSSSIYILNDIVDIENDKKHPEKRNRPLASGKVSVKEAQTISFILFVSGILIALFFNNLEVFYLFLTYTVINILYTFWIKHIGIIDVFTIAIGFVIRILIGGASGDIKINSWIIIMTFLLALFLGFAKRRDDLLIAQKTGRSMRKSVDGYNLQFVDSILVITSAVTLVSYLMYTLSEQTIIRYESDNIFITSIFVLMGILRYLQLSITFGKSGSPTDTLFKDRIIQISILGWIITFAIILYL